MYRKKYSLCCLRVIPVGIMKKLKYYTHLDCAKTYYIKILVSALHTDSQLKQILCVHVPWFLQINFFNFFKQTNPMNEFV